MTKFHQDWTKNYGFLLRTNYFRLGTFLWISLYVGFCFFRLNDIGEVEKIFYNNQSRSRIMISSDADETKMHYQAMKLLDSLAYTKKFLIETKLNDGNFWNQILLFGLTKICLKQKKIIMPWSLFLYPTNFFQTLKMGMYHTWFNFWSFLGECISFDNTRILHGRKGYVANQDSSRLYQGSYVAWDEIRSRMNVIRYMKSEEEPH